MSGLKRFGSYYLIKKIATGGMAELYKAKKSGEKGFEKLLAIKLILPHLAASDEFITMFIDEAKVAALLNHQNIVQIYDLGRIEDSYCIVMEYVRGKDLRSVIARAIKMRASIKMEHACLITASALAGLSYAHRKKDKGKDLNIVHRDISPQNILISYEGEVKIVDFGIAKAATQSRDTKAGVLKGKISYMSPEQAQGRALDLRSDLFSIGVVLYEMLTGRKLFQGDTDIATLELVRAARVEPLPSRLSKSFPAELETILLKALAKDPEQRYQTAADMESALLEFMRSRGYSTSGYSLSEYMHRLFRDEIEEETTEEQELDKTVLSGTADEDTLTGAPAAQAKPAPRAATPPRPAPAPTKPGQARAKAPKGRDVSKTGRGGLAVAALSAVLIVAGVLYAGSRLMGDRQSAVTEAPLTAPAPESAPVPETAPVPGTDTVPEAPVPGTDTVPDAPVPNTDTVPAAPEPKSAPVPVVPAPKPAPAPQGAPVPVVVQAAISSDPPGAEVFVDGKPAGRTPSTLKGVKSGVQHSVRMTLDGYNDWTGSFKAGPGETAAVNAALKETAFSIDVRSNPAGAKVWLDGRDTGRLTPARVDGLKPGTRYGVRVELDGFAPFEEKVTSQGTGTVSVSAELARQYGMLTVNSRPWAFVIVDGEKLGMTPLAGIRLTAGEHSVLLDNPRRNMSKTMKVRIKPDETTRVVTELGN